MRTSPRVVPRGLPKEQALPLAAELSLSQDVGWQWVQGRLQEIECEKPWDHGDSSQEQMDSHSPGPSCSPGSCNITAL